MNLKEEIAPELTDTVEAQRMLAIMPILSFYV
jgi:hypothetical protein